MAGVVGNNWQHDPGLMDRVVLDMRGVIDPGLRADEMVESWRGMLCALLQDSNIQFATRRCDLALVENAYARGEQTEEALLLERTRYLEWKRKALAFHRAILQRLAEANDLVRELNNA